MVVISCSIRSRLLRFLLSAFGIIPFWREAGLLGIRATNQAALGSISTLFPK
ncbi:MAG: hypothetical protein IPN96_18085 [Anaerolineales bacterium]|nr:hypothetical protein [Anaerolineales bacterium]